MYKKKSQLKQPDNTRQSLWRYMKLERLIQLLENGTLYFPRLDAMQDGWEGRMTARTKQLLYPQALEMCNGNPEAATKQIDRTEAENLSSFYINCWHMNEHESYLMWKTYGNREVAIKTNYERLVHAFEDSGCDVEGCAVTYMDYIRDTKGFFNEQGHWNGYIPVSHKDLPYIDEKEFRLLFWKTGLGNQGYPINEKGASIKIDTAMLLDEVYINPSMNPDLSRLYELIAKQAPECAVNITSIRE